MFGFRAPQISLLARTACMFDSVPPEVMYPTASGAPRNDPPSPPDATAPMGNGAPFERSHFGEQVGIAEVCVDVVDMCADGGWVRVCAHRTEDSLVASVQQH